MDLLAEIAMTAAIVTLAAALVASLGLLAYLSVRLVSALDDVADLRAHEEALAGQLLVAQANAETQENRADAEKRRADALDDLLDHFDPADAGAARAWVLSHYQRTAADGDGARAVPADAAKEADARGGRDALLRPGE